MSRWKVALAAGIGCVLVAIAVGCFQLARIGDQWWSCHQFESRYQTVYSAVYHPLDSTCVLYTTVEAKPATLVWDGSAWVSPA